MAVDYIAINDTEEAGYHPTHRRVLKQLGLLTNKPIIVVEEED